MDITLLDEGLLLEAAAFPRLEPKERAAEIRQRLLAIMLDGLRANAASLPGKSLTWKEQEQRWRSAR